MSVTLGQLAGWVDGELVGDGDQLIADARPLTEAAAGDITFVEDDRHLNAWKASPATAAVVTASFPANGRPLIRVADPLMAFARIVLRLRGLADESAAIDPAAHVHPTAIVGPDVSIGPFAVIGAGSVLGPRCRIAAGVVVGRNCTLAADVTLHPHVVLYDDCHLGERVIVHANAVIGADGFGYRMQQGRHVKVPQLGRVEIGADVEIGAGSTIDRGTFGPTRIGAGTKIDNLVMVAHNCQIGRHNLLVAQVGIAGSTSTGDYVVMAGQVGVSDHLHIGDRVQIGAKSGIHKDVPPDSRMLGAPATAHKDQMRIMMSLERLPEIRKDVNKIKQHLGLEDAA